MTTSTDPMQAARAVMEQLTGPGGPFELRETDVLGSRLPVFVNQRHALHELLAESAEYGDRTYIATACGRISFAEHAAQVASLARALREDYGVRPGDRVAIAAANSPSWITTFWATVSIGAVSVGLNAWWSARELAYGVEDSRPTVIVADAKRATLLANSAVPVLTVEEDIPRLSAVHPGEPLPSAEVAEDDPAVILYTSGTSGRPKGVVHTHRNLLAVAEYHRMNDALAQAFGDPTDPHDRSYLLVLPLFHIASLHNLVLPRLATGSKIALHQGAFDVDKVLRLVEAERVTNWGAVPTMAHRLLEHGDLACYDTSSLTAFSLSSAPSSIALKQRLREGLPFASGMVDSYGLTETCTGAAVATPMDLAEAPGTLGRPIVGVQMEVRDPFDNPVGPGVEGEICVRSVYNMLGYWDNVEATARTIGQDRWLHTGDIGEMDEQGRVRLTSRRSDLIIRGGENVYPVEIEAVLDEYPGVQECAVLGVENPELGQEVAAVIVCAAGATVTEENLREFAAEQLAYFKVPSRWRFTEEPLRRNATGKIFRTGITAIEGEQR